MNRFVIICVLAGILLGSLQVFGQNTQSPYFPLRTLVGQVVRDTLAGQNLKVELVSPLPKRGKVVANILAPGTTNSPAAYELEYVPEAGFTGVDTFTVALNYSVTFPFLVYRAYRVSVYASGIQAQSDLAVTSANQSIEIDVLANDASTTGNLSITALPLVNGGWAAVTPNQKIVFQPFPDFSGVAHVSYVVCDGNNTCETGRVSIGVQAANNSTAPLQVATPQQTPLYMPLGNNDYSVFQAPAHGTVTLTNGQQFKYVPTFQYTGNDVFVLSRPNGNQQRVEVQVLPTTPPNTMAVNDYVYTPQRTAVSFNVRRNDIGELPVRSWQLLNGEAGTLSGTTEGGNAVFTPAPDFTGVAVIQYTLGNQYAEMERGTAYVVVSNAAPASPEYILSTARNKTLVIDYPAPFAAFSFQIKQGPKNGTVRYYPGWTTQTTGTGSVAGYNLVLYNPTSNFQGRDSFLLDYCAGGSCVSVQVKVDVTDVPNAGTCLQDCVWPGDMNDDGIVNHKDLLTLGYHLGTSGTTRKQADLQWRGQAAKDWDNEYAGAIVDLKHADTDGNGVLTHEDASAIYAAYGKTHQLKPDLLPTTKGLPFVYKVLTPDAGVGDVVEIEVALGSDQVPVTNVHGFALDVTLSPTIRESDFTFTFDEPSWINRNAPYLTLAQSPRQGRIEAAFSRAGGSLVSGSGRVGKARFIIIDVIEGGKDDGNFFAVATFQNSQTVWGSGHIEVGEPVAVRIPIRRGADIRPLSSEKLRIFPSPARDYVQLYLNGDETMQSLSILDAQGRSVYQSGAVQWKRTDLAVADWPAGHYVALVRTASGQVAKQFTVVKQ